MITVTIDKADIYEELESAGCWELPSYCHLCYQLIDYCQGHGDETCACICDEGCYCGDCGFEANVETALMQEAYEVFREVESALA